MQIRWNFSAFLCGYMEISSPLLRRTLDSFAPSYLFLAPLLGHPSTLGLLELRGAQCLTSLARGHLKLLGDVADGYLVLTDLALLADRRLFSASLLFRWPLDDAHRLTVDRFDVMSEGRRQFPVFFFGGILVVVGLTQGAVAGLGDDPLAGRELVAGVVVVGEPVVSDPADSVVADDCVQKLLGRVGRREQEDVLLAVRTVGDP